MNDLPLAWGLPVLLPLLLLGVYGSYLAFMLIWSHLTTSGTAYFGKPLAQRRRFRKTFQRLGFLAKPVCRLIGPTATKLGHFRYRGVYFPPLQCSPISVRRAARYAPQANDVFVASQMKCGTTWLQQIVYEVLMKGRGDLSDTGHIHLYAMSPWLESFNSVSVQDAPLIGQRQTRIIKTHFPASLCPYSERAKYLYVTRHPVSCFASTLDFTRTLLGPMAPDAEGMLDRYCSDKMWWTPWPDHVDGYWRWAKTHPNVLFVHFEDMKADSEAIIRLVAAFLEYPLDEDEIAIVVEKCSFQYMKQNEELFEMSPPTLFSPDHTFFKSGSSQRHKHVEPEHAQRILDFCRQRLRDSDYPFERYAQPITPSLRD